MKKIAVLTSGGDAPGMNAAVRAVVRTALHDGMEVLGVVRGYNGLINGDLKTLDQESLSGVLQRGGTFLYSARSPEFRTEEGMQKAIENCKKNGIEGVVVCGGDGSFRGAQDLSRRGIPCIGIPCTIDNDISSTEQTIGYDTAMNIALDMVDRLSDTAESHDRCSVIEVMGRNAGYIALNVGIATGATSILVAEIDFDFEKDVIERIRQSKKNGRHHFVVVVAEGVEMKVAEIAKRIEEETGVESRATVLGHVQRGGSPTVRDRVLASRMGHYAVKLLEEGKSNRVVALQKEQLVDYDIEEALAMKKDLERDIYEMAFEIAD